MANEENRLPMNFELALKTLWGRLAFSAVWVAAQSACWGVMQRSAVFHSILNYGTHLNWAAALLYTIATYLVIAVGMLWIGLAVYLVATCRFGAKTLFRGLLVLVFVVFVMMGLESFVRVAHLSAFAEYTLRWLPMLVSLFVASSFAVPSERRSPFSRAMGKS